MKSVTNAFTILFMATVMFLFASSNVFASKTNDVNIVDSLHFSVDVGYVNVFNRDLDTLGTELSYSSINVYPKLRFDMIEFYNIFGYVNSIETDSKIEGHSINIKYENNYRLGAGLNVDLYEITESTKLTGNVQYIITDDIEYDSLSIDGQNVDTGSDVDMKLQEYSANLMLHHMYNEMLTVRGGVALSDVKFDGNEKFDGQSVDLKAMNSENNVGLRVGAQLTPFANADYIKVNAAGSFVDKTELFLGVRVEM